MDRRLTILAVTASLAAAYTPAFGDGNAAAPTATAAQTPAAPTPAAAPPAVVVVDPAITALLSSVQGRLKSFQAISATVETSSVSGQAKTPARRITDVELMRPNYANISAWEEKLDPATNTWSKSKPQLIQVGDAKNVYFWMAYNNKYTKSDAVPTGENISLGPVESFGGFFSDKSSINEEIKRMNENHFLASVDLKPTQLWNGAAYSVVEIGLVIPNLGPSSQLTEDLYIGNDQMIHRLTLNSSQINEDMVVNSVQINPVLNKMAFNFTPPTGSTLLTPPPPAPPLLKTGSAAPDFTVKDPTGNPVKLSDYRGKVVVIDFWATWCGPCQRSLPHTNEVAAKFKGKDVVFLAVNTWDTVKAFNDWLPQHKDYDALDFVIDTSPQASNIAGSLYHVSGIPTQYVIDKAGKVANSFVGYGGPTDDLENAVKAAGG